ncbi:MAG TPA: hypothetical protein VE987_04620 [Polyangiaceae bacterium]|nr:hypothetical protein [Polyangiaceae bacterium]
MSKSILTSILAATFLIPLVFARDPQPRRGLRKVVRWFAAYCVLYVFAILYVMARL